MKNKETYWKTNLKYLVILYLYGLQFPMDSGSYWPTNSIKFKWEVLIGLLVCSTRSHFYFVILIFVYIYLMNRLDENLKIKNNGIAILVWIAVGLSFTLSLQLPLLQELHLQVNFTLQVRVFPIANGMATAADWMSAASFISMAGIISFNGYDGSVFLMGWTGGYVLLALLAPYLENLENLRFPILSVIAIILCGSRGGCFVL